LETVVSFNDGDFCGSRFGSPPSSGLLGVLPPGGARIPLRSPPLVSVVTCFLNAGPFLQDAVESVLAQTHRAWELLLVDDGSTDASTEIARRCASRHPGRARYLEHGGHRNRGSSASRNLALRHARGEYVAILDADDVFLPQALERRVAVLESHPEVGMVYGPALLWHGWTGDAGDQRRDREQRLHLETGTVFPPPTFCAYLLDYNARIPSPCAILLRRRAVDAVGGFEDSFHDLFDDQVLYIKLSLRTAVLVSGECDSKYRQHPASTCAVADRAGRTDAARLVYLDWVERYVAGQGVRDERLRTALRAIRFRFRWPRAFRLSQLARHFANRLRAS
jgi:glycosyltransferase involved in cell wall biosynthesis